MMITDSSKRVIPFRERDAKRIGEGCFYLDSIVWLNGDRIELGDNVGFNVGCFVNGFSGLIVGDGTNFGPYSMVHTANHNMEDTERPVTEQGWRDEPPVRIGRNCWVGMGAMILPGVQIGDGVVIGAGSVVVRDVEDYAVVVGNPAKTDQVAQVSVLFLQQQPCVRAMKYAVGLAGQVELGFAYRGRTLSELYGAGDELFEAWYPLGDDPAAALPEIVEAFAPDVIHSHNLPGRADRAGARQRATCRSSTTSTTCRACAGRPTRTASPSPTTRRSSSGGRRRSRRRW